jgi:glycosyltransferase involved in cell wall biosynthesis
LGGVLVDIIDPVLNEPDFAQSVRDACEAAGVLHRVAFHAGQSPAAIEDLAGSQRRRWSMFFIDGDHEGAAPRLDAQAAMAHAEDTALVLFHDLASPYVAAGLDAFREAGWRTRVYQTMQIMGVAWRGDVEPVPHRPDPSQFWTLPRHLAGYEVSGWQAPARTPDKQPVPGGSGAQSAQGILRAQEAQDELAAALAARDMAASQIEAAARAAEIALAERQSLTAILTDLRGELEASAARLLARSKEVEASQRQAELVKNDLARQRAFSAGLRTALDRALTQAPLEERERRRALIELANWLTGRRVLAGMLRRPASARLKALQSQCNRLGLPANTARAAWSALTRRRALIGLLRRTRGHAAALAAVQLLQLDLSEPVRPLQPWHTNPRRFDPRRDNIILVVHETSRTGAPILGWNIAMQLADRYNIFTIRLNDGALTPEFEELSAETHGPFLGPKGAPDELMAALWPLFTNHKFRYAIVNSSESRRLLSVCAVHKVPTLLLMHEFGSYVYPHADLCQGFDDATEVIFPARIVADSSLALHPPLQERGVKIMPQGMSEVPTWNKSDNQELEATFSGLLRIKASGACIVIGAGSVNIRKGVDLFLATAAAARRMAPARPVHFVWVGHGYAPTADMGYSVYLLEQLQRSGLEGSFTFLGEVSDLEPVFALADAFLLSSRLDPLPNVSIDAAHRGLPIVCFRDASGMAELLLTDPETAEGVVAHLDTEAAARLLVALAADEPRRRALGAATSRFAARMFDMRAYVARLDELGRRCAASAGEVETRL